MKKTILFTFIMTLALVLIVAGCGNTNEEEYYDSESSDVTVDTNNREEIFDSVKWTEKTIKYSDDNGYEFSATLKISPWFLNSNNADTLEAMWSFLEKDKEFPGTIEDWGVEKSGYQRNLDEYLDVSDMWIAIGTMRIENVTEGWDVTEESSANPEVFLEFVGYNIEYDPKYNDEHEKFLSTNRFLSTIYYGDEERFCSDDSTMHIKPKMTSNSWGPVTFVAFYPENITPNNPEGEHLEEVSKGNFVFGHQYNSGRLYNNGDPEGVRLNLDVHPEDYAEELQK